MNELGWFFSCRSKLCHTSDRETIVECLQRSYDLLLRDLAAALKLHYHERLISPVVSGSVGRGTERFDSDVDLLIVAEPLPKGRLARLREFDDVDAALSSRLRSMKKKEIHATIAPIFKTQEEVTRGSLLFLDMIDDAGCFTTGQASGCHIFMALDRDFCVSAQEK